MNKILSSLFLFFILAGTVPIVWAHKASGRSGKR